MVPTDFAIIFLIHLFALLILNWAAKAISPRATSYTPGLDRDGFPYHLEWRTLALTMCSSSGNVSCKQCITKFQSYISRSVLRYCVDTCTKSIINQVIDSVHVPVDVVHLAQVHPWEKRRPEIA